MKKETTSVNKIDYMLEYECFNKSQGDHDVGRFKGNWTIEWHLGNDSFSQTDMKESGFSNRSCISGNSDGGRQYDSNNTTKLHEPNFDIPVNTPI